MAAEVEKKFLKQCMYRILMKNEHIMVCFVIVNRL